MNNLKQPFSFNVAFVRFFYLYHASNWRINKQTIYTVGCNAARCRSGAVTRFLVLGGVLLNLWIIHITAANQRQADSYEFEKSRGI